MVMMNETKKWLINTCIRSVKAMAHSAMASIGATSFLSVMDIKLVTGTAAMAGVLSILMSISNLPEKK